MSRAVISEELGIVGRHVPDAPEDFDEFEFGSNFDGFPKSGFTVAVERGLLKRIMFGKFDAEDPDLFMPFSEEELARYIDQNLAVLQRFFATITKGD